MEQLQTLTEAAKPIAAQARLAIKLDTVAARREAHIAYGRVLLPIRKLIAGNIEFAHYLDQHGLAVGTPQYRTDAMRLAEIADVQGISFERCLNSNPGDVLKWLRRQDPNAKPRKANTKVGETKRALQAREIVRPLVESGEHISVQTLSEDTGISRIVLEAAITAERGRLQGIAEAKDAGLPDQELLSVTGNKRVQLVIERVQRYYAAKERSLERAFDHRISIEVQKHYNETVLPMLKKKLEDADKTLDNYIPPFSNDEYRKLLAALHPDVNKTKWAAELFALVTHKAIKLRGREDGKRLSDDFPTSFADLMKRREAVRKANSERSKAAATRKAS